MLGTAPSFIAFTYCSTIYIHRPPSRTCPLTVLGFILLMTFLLRSITCSTNSALSSSSSIPSRFYSSSSLVKGLIIVQHSLSLKYILRCFLISFFESQPLSYKALSRYSLEFISFPSSSTICKAKSLTTHINEGIYSTKLSMSSSGSKFYSSEDLNCMCFVIFTTRESDERAFSSIDPTEL